MGSTVCKRCDEMPNITTNGLLLRINGTPYPLMRYWGGNNYSCSMGYETGNTQIFRPNTWSTSNYKLPFKIPSKGGLVNFKLESICQYPLWSGYYPPDGPEVGRLRTAGAYNSIHTGYDVTIDFPPSTSNAYTNVFFAWCGTFYASESQFLEECDVNAPGNTLYYSCKFHQVFELDYEKCPSCVVQTVETPSTRLNAIVDEQNVYWPLDNGVFTDCIVNSTGTRNALDKIKAKLIEIDNFYGGCSTGDKTVTAQAIPDTKGNCIRFIAKGFKNKFRILHWGGANDPAWFNHDSC